MDLRQYLNQQRDIVDKALEEALPPGSGPSGELIEAMRYCLFAGGKRLRPILCLAGAEAVGETSEAVLKIGLALEMIHTYSLIHDDLPSMDDDDFRRGKPTCHKVYGEAMAILAGDGLLTEGLAQIAQAAHSPKVLPEPALEVLALITGAAGYKGMVGGQANDLMAEGVNLNLDRIQAIHRDKTGKLLMASVVSGGILAGADQKQKESLILYGESIGFAFQIIDDILDVEGSSEALGKTTGMDEKRGKATYPGVAGMDKAKADAGKLIKQALKALGGFGSSADPLREIASYMLTRQN